MNFTNITHDLETPFKNFGVKIYEGKENASKINLLFSYEINFEIFKANLEKQNKCEFISLEFFFETSKYNYTGFDLSNFQNLKTLFLSDLTLEYLILPSNVIELKFKNCNIKNLHYDCKNLMFLNLENFEFGNYKFDDCESLIKLKTNTKYITQEMIIKNKNLQNLSLDTFDWDNFDFVNIKNFPKLRSFSFKNKNRKIIFPKYQHLFRFKITNIMLEIENVYFDYKDISKFTIIKIGKFQKHFDGFVYQNSLYETVEVNKKIWYAKLKEYLTTLLN